MDETAQLQEKMVAMNEALLLGSVRQHELTEAAEKLNEQLRAEITAREQAEEGRARLAAIVESSDDAMIGYDPNGIITSWNKGAGKIFGYAAVEMVGTSILRLIPADRQDEEHEILARIRSGESVKHFETLRQTKDGRLIDVSVTASPIMDATGKVTGVSKVARDISDRKRAQEVIRRLNTELETRVEQRTLELRTVNEELRRQIAMRRKLEEEILEISEREQRRIGQDLHDDLGQQLVGAWMLATALKLNLTNRAAPEVPAATRISDILEQALATTRSLARGLHPIAPESGGLISALHDLAGRTSGMFHIDCRFECAVAVQVGDNTTATHLYRIAQEAVSNGVKHGRAKRVRVSLSSHQETIMLTVKDDGSGIGPLDPNRQGMGLRIIQLPGRHDRCQGLH